MKAELADRNLRVNLRGNQNLLIWGHRYYLYTKKTGPYFQKVLQSSKNSHRPSSQSENTKLSKKNIHKERMSWNLKEQIIPISDSTASPLHCCASRTFQIQA
jgi:hypothetical protein